MTETHTPATLFDPVIVGDVRLTNRIVMAPLTRNRVGPGLVPGPFAAEYYAQRATAGLIIAEATQVSEQAQGYSDTPGCPQAGSSAPERCSIPAVCARSWRQGSTWRRSPWPALCSGNMATARW